MSAGLGKAWEHYLNLVPFCRVSLGSPSPLSLEAFLGQLPIQMLGLDLEQELAFLDKPTQGLVLVVRYVCAFVIKRNPSRALLWDADLHRSCVSLGVKVSEIQNQVVCCKLEHKQV